MSDTALAPAKVETQQPVESKNEAPKQGMESGMESGEASGVFRRAQADVDKTVASELAISKVDDPKAAKVAAAEVARLKQTDAAFQTKADESLKKLKSRLPLADSQMQHEVQMKVNAVEAMKTGPLNMKEFAQALDEPQAKVEAKPETKEPGTVELSPEKLARLVVVAEDLTNEETALHEFEQSHTHAVTKLEEAYLTALKSRVDALSFERKSIESGQEDQQAITDHRMKADEAEGLYSKMYQDYLNEPTPVQPEAPKIEMSSETLAKSGGEDLEEVDEEPDRTSYDMSQRPDFGRPSHFNSNAADHVTSMPEQPKPPGRAGQAVGKFVEGLKFWKYFTRK